MTAPAADHQAAIAALPTLVGEVDERAAGTPARFGTELPELFAVNSVSERHIPGYLVRNRRVAIALDSPTHGRLTVVMVAALMVGRITVTGVDAPDVLNARRPPSCRVHTSGAAAGGQQAVRE
jgi:phosphatidylserine decarboxylase